MNRTALVVDDDELFGRALAEMLTFLDFTPTVCATARQALNLITSCDFRFIFTDIRMPEVDGFQFYGFLAALNEALVHRVIFLTGDMASFETREMIERLGAICIQKPVKFDTLERAIAAAAARIESSKPATVSKAEQAASARLASQSEPPGSIITADGSKPKDALALLEGEWNQALVRADAATLDRLLSDGFIATLSTGKRWTKQEVLLFLQIGEDVVAAAETDDLKIVPYGDGALAYGRSTRKQVFHGQDVSGQFRFSKFWMKLGGGWQCVASHESAVGPSESSETTPS